MQGTRDPSAWLTVPAAIAFRTLHGWDRVAAQCHDLVQDTARRVAKLTNLAPFSSPEFCAPQMVSMPVPLCDTADLQRQLLAQYGIEIPCFTWQNHCIVRVSAQGYNTQIQIDLLVHALTTLLN